MSVISMKQLLEAGVHFGHQTRRWNPKMKKYIFVERNGIYIIDLQKTVKKLEEAYDFMRQVGQDGGKVLFVGTKKQAQEAIKDEAERSGNYYINQRWLGGTLTNFGTIQKRVARMKQIEKMEEEGTFEVLPKKEVIQLKKEHERVAFGDRTWHSRTRTRTRSSRASRTSRISSRGAAATSSSNSSRNSRSATRTSSRAGRTRKRDPGNRHPRQRLRSCGKRAEDAGLSRKRPLQKHSCRCKAQRLRPRCLSEPEVRQTVGDPATDPGVI